MAGKRDADDLVAGIDGLLEEVLEHHGRDLARAGQLVGFYEALEELLARKVDALGVLFGAECDGHGDDGNVVGAGVASSMSADESTMMRMATMPPSKSFPLFYRPYAGPRRGGVKASKLFIIWERFLD